jgi:protein archease
MEPIESAGFKERAHTADWALDVWAPDMVGLLEQAARGMYELMDTHLAAGPRLRRQIQVEAEDAEGLLVAFLSELLFLGEQEGLGFDQIELHLQGWRFRAELKGAPMISQSKEIKAVTYHNLQVRWSNERLEATIVFDV